MRARFHWAQIGVGVAILLLPLKIGGCGKTACITVTSGQLAKNGGACPSQAEALGFFTGTAGSSSFGNQEGCGQGAVTQVDGAGELDGDLCCYPVDLSGNSGESFCGGTSAVSGAGDSVPSKVRAPAPSQPPSASAGPAAPAASAGSVDPAAWAGSRAPGAPSVAEAGSAGCRATAGRPRASRAATCSRAGPPASCAPGRRCSGRIWSTACAPTEAPAASGRAARTCAWASRRRRGARCA